MNQNVIIIAVVAFCVLAIIAYVTLSKKEGFMETIEAPGVLSWPTYLAANDPRSDPSVNSGVVKDAINEFSLRAAPMDAANYSVDEMIDLGGCAALKALPKYAQGGFASDSDEPVRAAFAKASANTVAAMAATSAKFGRENVYNNAVSAEQMLPATEITAAVDPTQNFIYQRSLNTQMKRRPLGQQDLIRGDIKPINALGRETYAASFNSGQSSQGPSGANFVSRYGNNDEVLSKGYFSNFNDIEQTMTRNESLMQTRAQFSRDQQLVKSVDVRNQAGNFLNATVIEGILGGSD
jgi:hypothetical protein